MNLFQARERLHGVCSNQDPARSSEDILIFDPMLEGADQMFDGCSKILKDYTDCNDGLTLARSHLIRK